MKCARLKGTDLSVSELGVGCARIGGLFHKAPEKESIGLLRAAFDAGINFFDTADIYGQGESERLIGKAFASCRSQVVIESKVGYQLPGQRRLVDRIKPLAKPIVRRLGLRRGNTSQRFRGTLTHAFSVDRLRTALQGSLQRLQTDYIDMYMLHGLPAEQREDAMAWLEEVNSEGLIRHYGVSCEDEQDSFQCLHDAHVSAIQVPFNLLHQETGTVIEASGSVKKGIVARQCYASGLLARPTSETDFSSQPSDRLPRVQALQSFATTNERSLAELALQFVLGTPGVDTTLIGVSSPDHLKDALNFYDAPALTKAERDICLGSFGAQVFVG